MDNEMLNDNNFDAWNGYQQPLFQVGDEEDDKEAEEVYKYNFFIIFLKIDNCTSMPGWMNEEGNGEPN